MTLVYYDRVWETTSTQSTGAVTLLGAKTGYLAFSTVVADQNQISYCITDGSNWEVGQGTYTLSGTTLSRDIVYSSSNGNALVNFPAGTKDVFLTTPANLVTQVKIENTFVTAEPISGGRAANLSQSGRIQAAMASVSGRMPAFGVVVDNVVSGSTATVYTRGRITSVLLNFSGYIGQKVWAGTSGEIIVSAAPALSGNVQECLGFVTSHSGMIVGEFDYTLTNDFISSGDITSGSIDQNKLASGAVSSGQIASGNVITFSRNVMLDDFVANETVSGTRPVCLSSGGGGTILMAQGASGFRMPAIGVNIDNALSGGSVRVVMFGKILMTSGMDAAFSGQIGKPIYVASSGHLITSVKPVSGTLTQRIGTGISGGMIVQAFPMTSGNLFISGGTQGWMA